jgi:phospholipid transport system transporter-binding protein
VIRNAGERSEVVGPMTLDSARGLLEEGRAALAAGATVFDLGQVSEVDSSGLTVVFGWQRSAAGTGRAIRIVNPPRNLLSLAELYGVTDLLPLA